MAEYIEREALRQEIDRIYQKHFAKSREKSVQDVFKAFFKRIDKAPAADVEPVVRCKDCEHWNEDALACDTLPWVNSSEHANWYADDFCSYGERKEGEQDG